MRISLTVLLALHGLAHFAGFRSAFWPGPVRPERLIQLPRRLEGAAWLLLGLGFVLVAALLVTRHDSWHTLLFWVASGSLVLCLSAWPDAKIGLGIDAVLLVGAVLLAPANTSSRLAAAFDRELSHTGVQALPTPSEPIYERAIAPLPAPVQRYLRFMGVLGKPRDVSLRASFSGRFRREPGDWLACEVLQYDTRAPVARIFMMQLSLGKLLPVRVRDEYLRGHGSLEAKAFDLVPVARGSGPELDVGELVTYLNDAILMAPSLLLGPETSWKEVDASSFDVTLKDGASSVTARVRLDPEGAPLTFSTRDRFFDAAGGQRVRTEWRTPISGWQDAGGRKLPERAQAVWQLPGGPFAYADFKFDAARIAFNVPPP